MCTLIRGEALRQLETLSFKVGSISIVYLNRIILGLCMYFFSINASPKQKHAMRPRTRNPCELKMKRYNNIMIIPNEYLYAFSILKASDKYGETELNEILLNTITHVCSRQ